VNDCATCAPGAKCVDCIIADLEDQLAASHRDAGNAWGTLEYVTNAGDLLAFHLDELVCSMHEAGCGCSACDALVAYSDVTRGT